MTTKKFEKALLALFKEHGIDSIRDLCYNDPDKANAANEGKEEWDEKYEAWLEENPEPPYSYGDSAKQEIWDAWMDKRDAELGEDPAEIADRLYRQYDEEYTPGIWYSSNC
jgi:hypothetical protein